MTIDGERGYEKEVVLHDAYMFKELMLNAGHRTSMHYHEHKHETLYVVHGFLKVEFIDGRVITLDKFEHVIIPPGKEHAHRMIAINTTRYVEASTPHPYDSIRLYK